MSTAQRFGRVIAELGAGLLGRLGRAPHGPAALFRGAPFDLTPAPNRFGLAPFYSQHVWLYRHDPAGILAMWDPKVHCP